MGRTKSRGNLFLPGFFFYTIMGFFCISIYLFAIVCSVLNNIKFCLYCEGVSWFS